MNLPAIINIAIGSIFIFLILSLLVAEIQELIATLLQWRAVHLKRAIEILLGSGEPTPRDQDIKKVEEIVNNLYDNPLIKNINQEAKKGVEAQFRKLTAPFADLGYEKGKNGTRGPKRRTAPSYIPAETFATTLLVRLGIPNLVRQLSWYNLRKVINNELALQIENTINNNEESVRSELKEEVSLLKQRLERIIDNFRNGKSTLPNCIAQVGSAIDIYIEESKKYFKDEPQKERFTKAIKFIQEDIFGLDEKHEELLQHIQPDLAQVVELLNEDSNISKAFFREIEEVIKDENSPAYNAYNDLQADLKKIIEYLPLNVQKSLATLAVRTRIKAKSIEEELNQFKQEVEVWFDRSMDRASGVYKRNAKGVAFLLGFIVAAIANADTFHIVSRLSNDDAVQKAIIDSASQTTTGDISEIKTEVNRALTDISLPIGWTPANVCQQSGYDLNLSKKNETVSIFKPLELNNICQLPDSLGTKDAATTPLPKGDRRGIFILNRLLGWLLTGLATTMGAPFWFELLNKFINVRNTGKKPASPVDTQLSSGDRAPRPQQ